MTQARTIVLAILASLTIGIVNAQERPDLHIYGNTYALANVDLNSLDNTIDNDETVLATTVQTNIAGDQLIIQTNMSDLDEVLIFDMNGMLYDNHVISQMENQMILSFDNIEAGKYIVSLERASGHESFQVVKSNQ